MGAILNRFYGNFIWCFSPWNSIIECISARFWIFYSNFWISWQSLLIKIMNGDSRTLSCWNSKYIQTWMVESDLQKIRFKTLGTVDNVCLDCFFFKIFFQNFFFFFIFWKIQISPEIKFLLLSLMLVRWFLCHLFFLFDSIFRSIRFFVILHSKMNARAWNKDREKKEKKRKKFRRLKNIWCT